METNVFLTRENVTIHDFERVCRTCLSTVDLKPISDVFDSEHFPVEIALNKYTQIQFHLLDKLPKQICSNCVQNLNSSYNFLLNCDLVNTSLKKCLPPYEKNFPTNDCLPNAIEYVNCQIKQEPALFDSCELETNEYSIIPPLTKSENLHTTIDIKEESLDNLEYENDTDSCDADGEQIITHVKQNRKNTPETSTQFNIRSTSRDSSMESTAPSVVETDKELPKKLQKRYEICYTQFMSWRETKNISSSFSENVLIAYFKELVTKIKPTSLWTQYFMLRKTLDTHHDVNITYYLKLKALLKRNLDGYQPKKSKTLTSEEINKFLHEAPDNIYLLTKVALIFGINGACRKGELCQLKIDDITDQRSAVLVNINDSKIKKTRSFRIAGEFYNIYKKYARLRPLNVLERRFFLQYQNKKCTRQPVGINKFGCIPKQVATYLDLKNPELYTGHCFRRSSTSLFVDAHAGGDTTTPNALDIQNIPQV